MVQLVARLRKMLDGSDTFTDDDLQELLDNHAMTIDVRLTSRTPFYTQHIAPVSDLEDTAIVYVGLTALVKGSDYTIDLQRGIVTTPVADYRGLMLHATSYDLNASAADGWERIAGGKVGHIDISANQASQRRSQGWEHAVAQAAHYRARARVITGTVDRADTPGGSRTDDLLDGFRRQTER